MMNHVYPSLVIKEPRSSVPVTPQPTVGIPGRGSTLRETTSTPDWERYNVIDHTGGSVHVHCELVDVRHGNLGDDPSGDDLATLMVFQFRFGE